MNPWNSTRRCGSERQSFGTALLTVISGLMIISGLLTGSTAVAALDQATDDFNVSVGLYRSGRWELAAETLQQFLKDYPNHPRSSVAGLYLGLSLSSLEKYDQAKPYFAEFLQREGDSPLAADARYRLGECSYHLRDYDAAVDQLTEFLERHPEHTLNSWARLFLADCLNSQRQWVKSETILRELIGHPAAAQIRRDAQFSLATSFEGQNRLPEAFLLYREVAADDESPVAPRALARIGTAHYNQKQYVEAAEAYDTIVRRFPRSGIAESAQLNSGVALYRAGQFEQAIARLQQIPGDSTNSAQALFISAMSLRELKKVPEARGRFADALLAAGETPLAMEILFQRAQFERVEGEFLTAAQMFEDITDRWPSDARVPECLFNAAEIHLELGDQESAGRLWNRLARDHSEAARRVSFQVLHGRILLGDGKKDQAVAVFEAVVADTSTLTPADAGFRMHLVARYYLARTQFDRGQYEAVPQITQPVLSELQKPENDSLLSMLALASISSLKSMHYQEAIGFADVFLKLAQDPQQQADVLATRCVANAHLKQFAMVQADATTLVTTYPQNPQTWVGILQAAEIASDERDYAAAKALFELSSRNTDDATVGEAALVGIAWCQFHLKEFADAERQFARAAAEFPEGTQFPQMIYMQGRSLEEAGNLPRAALQYQAVFEKLTQDVAPAAPGAEQQPPLQYAFDAGRQAARIFSRSEQLDQANSMWEAVLSQFPAAKNMDQLLEEWAWLNASAERFEQSDRIYRQLLDRFPESRYAGQARLSLAESELTAGRIDAAKLEFAAIVEHSAYGAAEKETALFHLADISTTALDWKQARAQSDQFLTNYPSSALAPQARLFLAEALVKQDGSQPADAEQAVELLSGLQQDVLQGKIPPEPWTDRVWVVQAELALVTGRYADIDELAGQLVQRNPDSPFLFQLRSLQGRRWKNQAPPDFDKARDYFTQVINDPVGARTETAAQSHFLLAETFVLEKKYEDAIREFFKIRFGYPYDIWREQALFQAANCELKLNQKAAARKTLEELIRDFPQSQFADPARERLQELQL